MYCRHCGEEINDNAVICPKCGCSTNSIKTGIENDSSSIGYAFLGFFIPIVGLILYLLWKNSSPLRAKSAGQGALISVIISAILIVIYFVLIVVILGSVSTYSYY